MKGEIIGICTECNMNMVITHRFGNVGYIDELKKGHTIHWMCPECGHKFAIVLD